MGEMQIQTKQERVYLGLRDRITDGTYEAGTRIVIDRIAGEFEVSALPVREAVRRLEAEGLVRFVPNAGAQVTPPDPDRYASNMRLLALLEGYATALAASRLTAAELDEMRAATADMQSAIEVVDAAGFVANNWRFHRVVYRACDEPALQAHLNSTQRDIEAVRRTAFPNVPYHGMRSVRDHQNLIDLIEMNAAVDVIERAARNHKLEVISDFNAWLRERGAGRREVAPGAAGVERPPWLSFQIG